MYVQAEKCTDCSCEGSIERGNCAGVAEISIGLMSVDAKVKQLWR